jgi:exonuclease III
MIQLILLCLAICVPLQAATVQLKVLSYNIKALPYPLGLANSKFELIGDVFAKRRALNNHPDIVLFQEAFSKSSIEIINKKAKYPYMYLPHTKTGKKVMNSGLAILSEFPLANPVFTRFQKYCGGPDCGSDKGFFYSDLYIASLGKRIKLVNTHLNATNRKFGDVAEVMSKWARKKQIRMSGHIIRDLNEEDPAIIMMGDYNVETTVKEEFDFLILKMRTTHTATYCTAPLSGCALVNSTIFDEVLGDNVDHHFFRPSTELNIKPLNIQRNFRASLGGASLSDHDGYEVQYEISNN